MTATEKWIVERDGKVTFVKELDGWSFMNAFRRGDETRTERVLDLNDPEDRALYERYK